MGLLIHTPSPLPCSLFQCLPTPIPDIVTYSHSHRIPMTQFPFIPIPSSDVPKKTDAKRYNIMQFVTQTAKTHQVVSYIFAYEYFVNVTVLFTKLLSVVISAYCCAESANCFCLLNRWELFPWVLPHGSGGYFHSYPGLFPFLFHNYHQQHHLYCIK